MPRKVQPKEYKGWPEDKRANYIRLFSLQERLRVHIKMAQELAKRNYYLKYEVPAKWPGEARRGETSPLRGTSGQASINPSIELRGTSGRSPRKTQPIRIASRPDDHLRRYREEQWPEIREYLKYVCEEIDEIKKAYKGGRPPEWYKSILMAESLSDQILEKMESIQVQLIVTLRSNISLKESNRAIIDETARVLILARDLREVLTFVPLDRSRPGLDEYGFEAIIDLSQPLVPQPIILDLTPLWQRSQQKKKLG